MTDRQQRINELEVLNVRLAWNHEFGCYTRNGFEYMKWPEIRSSARYIIYFDIDGMKGLNDELGKLEVNARIKQELSTLRATDYVFAGQYFSGDELAIVMCESPDGMVGDPKGLIERLADAFKAVGIKATYGFDQVKGADFVENVEPVAQLVHEYKKARGVTR